MNFLDKLLYKMGLIRISNDKNTTREIAARNRVDISLEEYVEMKASIKELKKENVYLREIVDRLNIPIHLDIIPGSIDVMTCSNPMNYITRYMITFNAYNR